MDYNHVLHRVRLALGIGKVRTTSDGGPVHVMQLQMSAAETRDGTPQVLSFGFHSNPPAGADVIYVSIGGDRGQTITIGTSHPTSRPRNIAQGGSVQHDQGGSQVLLNNDGTVQIIPSGGTATVKGNLVVTGSVQAAGEVTAMTGASPVRMSTHAHNKVTAGLANTGPPQPNS